MDDGDDDDDDDDHDDDLPSLQCESMTASSNQLRFDPPHVTQTNANNEQVWICRLKPPPTKGVLNFFHFDSVVETFARPRLSRTPGTRLLRLAAAKMTARVRGR